MQDRPHPALPSDYHIHTALCHHAEGEPGQYREVAAGLGIGEICFTDHMPTVDGYDPRHRMTLAQFPHYREMVAGLQGAGPPEVLFGLEADYHDGCETFLGDWLPARKLDFVLGSVHFIDGWGFDNPEDRHVWDRVDVTGTWRKYFDLIGRLADSGMFDAVAHLDLPKKFGYRPADKDLREMARPVLDRIARAGMGIELNTAGLRKPVGEIYPSPLLLAMAREREIPICFGSDAHRPEEVGAGFGAALVAARQAGYRECFRVKERRKTLVPLPDPESRP